MVEWGERDSRAQPATGILRGTAVGLQNGMASAPAVGYIRHMEGPDPLEAALQGKGEAALEDWAAQGRVGSSKWPRQWGEVVAEEQWEAMLRELRERQKATTEKAMELRQQQKKRKQERAEEEAVGSTTEGVEG